MNVAITIDNKEKVLKSVMSVSVSGDGHCIITQRSGDGLSVHVLERFIPANETISIFGDPKTYSGDWATSD